MTTRPQRALPELMTAKQIEEETGLSPNIVRSIMGRCLRVNVGSRRVVVKRADVLRVLRDDPPRGA